MTSPKVPNKRGNDPEAIARTIARLNERIELLEAETPKKPPARFVRELVLPVVGQDMIET